MAEFDEGTGSDEMVVMFCEHCEKEAGKSIDAEGFCVDCLEYMCATCLRFHKKYEPKHIVQDKNNMPQEFCTTKCVAHPKEIMKFYCESCEAIACMECKGHCSGPSCKVKFIPDIVRDKNVNENLKAVETQMNQFETSLGVFELFNDRLLETVTNTAKETLASVKLRKELLIVEIENGKKKVLDDLDRQKEELIKILDENKAKHLKFLNNQEDFLNKRFEEDENALRKEIETVQKNEMSRLQALKHEMKSLKSKLDSLQDDIKRHCASSGSQKCEVFIAQRRAETGLKILEKNYHEISKDIKDNYITNYEFTPSVEKVDIEVEKQPVAFGKLTMHKNNPKQVRLIGDVVGKYNEDKKTPGISGMCEVSACRLVAADGVNRSLKLIDTLANQILKVDYLSSSPYTLTSVSVGEVAVTLPEENKIQVLSVSSAGQFKLTKTITVEQPCCGIAYCDSHVFFTTEKNGIFMYNLKNGSVKNIELGLGTHLYQSLKHIVINQRLKILYVVNENAINSFTFDGRLLYTSAEFQFIRGLALDRFDVLYVSAGDSIYQFSFDLQASVILRFVDYTYPASLYYCNREDKLYVSKQDLIPYGTDRTIAVYKVR